jgi:LysR family transcriptional activator of nhaA
MVAREGSVARAAERLGLSHPTVSAQIHHLERRLGEKLFRREGRRLALTDVGRVALRYADEIFPLGQELLDAVRGRAVDRPLRLVVGVTDALPKSIVHRLIEPGLQLGRPVHLVCREGRSLEGFLDDLAAHRVDVVLADAPAGPGLPVRVWSHLLGESGLSLYAAAPLAGRLRRRFPRSLDGAPLLLPGEGSTLRRPLERWCESQGVRPRVVGEVDDAALLKVLGEVGLGVFVAPTLVEAELRGRYRVRAIGRAEGLTQRYFAISAERRLRHPGVVAVCEAARRDVFAERG